MFCWIGRYGYCVGTQTRNQQLLTFSGLVANDFAWRTPQVKSAPEH